MRKVPVKRGVYRGVTVPKGVSGLVGIKTITNQEATMSRKKRHILKTFVLGFAVAAVAAPTALGEPRGPGNPLNAPAASSSTSPDDRAFYRGGPQVEPQVVSPDDRAFNRGIETRPVTVSLSPDDRPFYRGAPTQSTPVSVSPDDRPFYRGVPTQSVPVSLTISASSDFQWDDAGLGAASALALIMLLGGGALIVRHQRHRIAAY
jgi:hypothetical protein